MAFRLASIENRAVLLKDNGVFDLEKHASGFSPDPMEAIARYRDLHEVAASLDGPGDGEIDPSLLSVPVPRPQKVLGIGLNYRAHAEESKMDIPEKPLVFNKLSSCVVGPNSDVIVFGPTTDWEAELVVVMGTSARDIPAEQAWDNIAGVTCGQDISERTTQFASRPPHFDLGKSYDTFGPVGPSIVSVDQLDNPNDLGLQCSVNGEEKQNARTSDLIFDVPALVEYISAICTLQPGDMIFTGTPSGVGAMAGTFLQPGDEITTTIETVGTMTNRCVAREE
jgi:2-keto-4-pentenoate hydratase/2-oxohepta-3-ene-1,7-dioic acid hydratase in catechol pathway